MPEEGSRCLKLVLIFIFLLPFSFSFSYFISNLIRFCFRWSSPLNLWCSGEYFIFDISLCLSFSISLSIFLRYSTLVCSLALFNNPPVLQCTWRPSMGTPYNILQNYMHQRDTIKNPENGWSRIFLSLAKKNSLFFLGEHIRLWF